MRNNANIWQQICQYVVQIYNVVPLNKESRHSKLHLHPIHSDSYHLKTLIWLQLVMIVRLSFMMIPVYVLTSHLPHRGGVHVHVDTV